MQAQSVCSNLSANDGFLSEKKCNLLSYKDFTYNFLLFKDLAGKRPVND